MSKSEQSNSTKLNGPYQVFVRNGKDSLYVGFPGWGDTSSWNSGRFTAPKCGYVSVNTGSAPDGNAIPIPKEVAEEAFDAAACIGCGACVATCKNASASLFVSAKVSQLALLPQGQPERKERVNKMVSKMDKEGFGHCTNTGACQAECPKEISIEYIRKMNLDYNLSNIKG